MGGARRPRRQRVLRARPKGGRLNPADVVDKILADYATTYCLRPVRRVDASGAARWIIDDDVMVEVIHGAAGREQVLVHEIGLLSELKKQLRSRRVSVDYVEKP